MLNFLPYISAAIMAVFLVLFLIRRNPYSKGYYIPPDPSNEIEPNVQWFKTFLPRARNKIGFVGGELNPIAYKDAQPAFIEALNNDVPINIIFGPRLAIEDRFASTKQDESESMFDVHPLFELCNNEKYPPKFSSLLSFYIPLI